MTVISKRALLRKVQQAGSVRSYLAVIPLRRTFPDESFSSVAARTLRLLYADFESDRTGPIQWG